MLQFNNILLLSRLYVYSGLRNKDGLPSCGECSLDKETATTMQVKVKKRCCRDCGHIHRNKEYCHVYVEVDEDYEDADDMEDEGDNSEDDDDALGYDRLKHKGVKQEVVVEHKPLSTPVWIIELYIYCLLLG